MNRRQPFILGLIACALAMGVALYFQYIEGLEPCPLCIFQRISVMALGAIFLVAALHGPGPVGRRVYGALLSITTLTGIGIAGRHLWLQYATHEELECGPGLDYMLEIMPLHEVLADVFKGTGDCAEIVWTFLGISIPGWTLVGLLFALWLSIWLLLKPANT